MKLYPYQETGRDFLASGTCMYLADEPGMGKTVEAIAALVKVGSKRPLVICPASVVGVWKAEWQLWGNPAVTLSVLSYSKLVADEKYRNAVLRVRPTDLVLDEAHYLKNAEAARTAWIIGNGKNRSFIEALNLNHIWLLSGTPDPNTPFELHHTLRQLWPHVLKSHGVWRADYWLGMFNWYEGYKPPGYAKPKPMITGMTDIGAQKLKNILQNIMLRRSMTSVGHELPDLDIRLTPIKPVDPRALELLGLSNETDEQTSTARRLLGQAKAPVVASIISDELDDHMYDKIVVFAYHRKSLQILRNALEKYGLVYLDGNTSEADRTEAVQLFQSDSTVRVFLGQQTAGGVGITLTGACNVVLVEPSWVPDDNIQAIKRVHRIGQDKHVLARLFTVAGTLDDDIIRTNHRKDSVKKTLARAETDS